MLWLRVALVFSGICYVCVCAYVARATYKVESASNENET